MMGMASHDELGYFRFFFPFHTAGGGLGFTGSYPKQSNQQDMLFTDFSRRTIGKFTILTVSR
jgi:hypothetical protein